MIGLKFTKEVIKNHWYELYAYQEMLADEIQQYLMNGFRDKYTEDMEEMHETITTAAYSVMEMLGDLSSLYDAFEAEALGFSVEVGVSYVGDEDSGFIVDVINVRIE